MRQLNFDCQVKKKKKQKTKCNQIINFIPTLLIPSYGYLGACYNNFTAISKPKIKPKTGTRSTEISRRSENTSPLLPSVTGVLSPICIFCHKRRKIGGSWKEPEKKK